MSQYLYQLDDNLLTFPPHHCALTDPNGLLAMGGDLSSQRLIQAYRHGVFPWFSEGDPLLWWSPAPRAILPCADIKINKTLKKFLNKSPYTVKLNTSFDQVIEQCADAPFRIDDTWIVEEMIEAYKVLHQRGFAQSIEVFDNEDLVGGLYGVAINGYFSGESMFYKKSNASKVALIALVNLLQLKGVSFIDCQIQNPFLESMGAVEVSREEFLHLHQLECQRDIADNLWQSRDISELIAV